MCDFCRTEIGPLGDVYSDNCERLITGGHDFSLEVDIMGDSLRVSMDAMDDEGHPIMWKTYWADINYCPMCGRELNAERCKNERIIKAKDAIVSEYDRAYGNHPTRLYPLDALMTNASKLVPDVSADEMKTALSELYDTRCYEPVEKDGKTYITEV